MTGLCRKCGRVLDPFLRDAGEEYHITCKPPTSEEIGQSVLEDLTDIIRWTDNNSTRSLQTTIGPSELGTDCDRKIAYRIAGTAETNSWMDPLPAIVGTSVHHWLEKAITKFQQVHHMDRFETELTVHPDPLVTGHCDLYDRDQHLVLDFKTVSPTKLKTWKSKGPSEQHKGQVQLYARGLIATGRPVSRVALMAVPRSGWLRECQIWVDDYRPEVAQAALDRLYAIADQLLAMGETIDFEQVPAEPGQECAYCPWYRGGSGSADLSGCAGNVSQSKAKFTSGILKPTT